MSRYIKLSNFLIKKIKTMYAQGFSYSTISIETGISVNVIRNRLGRTKDNPAVGKRMYFTPVIEKPVTKINKYDHLFEEPVSKGKMYEEYLKENNIKIHELL